MVFTIIFFMVFIYLLKNQSRERAMLVLLAFFAYLVLISGEQIYLENYFNRSFHVSDPSGYYDSVRNLSFNQLLIFLSSDEYKSNTFYYFTNWLFLNNFLYPSVTVLFIKLTNVLVFLSAYMLLVEKKSKINFIDRLIIFHPFIFLLVIRNVRDAYILFFIAMFIASYQSLKPFMQRLSSMFTAFLMMLTIRPFFTLLMLSIPLIKNTFSVSRFTRFFIFSLVILGTVFLLSNDLFGTRSKLLSAFMSTISYHDMYDQEREAVFSEVIQGEASTISFLLNYAHRILIGFMSFLFTPHPITYSVAWFEEEVNGMWNIYTTFDNLLIVLGAVVNYIIILPLVIKFLHKLTDINIIIASTSLFMLITYSIFQLGITDPRIKYSFFFFVLLGIKLSGLDKIELRKDIKYFFGVAMIFLAISFMGWEN